MRTPNVLRRHSSLVASVVLALSLGVVNASSATAVTVPDGGRAEVPDARARHGGPTIVAAGDISLPGGGQAAATADLVTSIGPTAVLTLGDNQYDSGALDDFNRYYDATWGAFKDKTYPAPGNHDCETSGCQGYFDYFGSVAGDGSYSFVLGKWLLVSLNSNADIGAQQRFLNRTLAHDHHRCELLYWHHPRWNSGVEHGPQEFVSPWWQTAYRRGVDVILNGHEHVYERFAKLNPSGKPTRDGIRQFTVGTGGADLYSFGNPMRGSQVRLVTYGVLEMQLSARSYTWAFENRAGRTLDSGSTRCHA